MEELFQSATITTNVTLDDIIALAITYYNIGLVYADYMEENELYNGINYFNRCIELLKGMELHRKAILTSIRANIKLQYILMKQKSKKSDPHSIKELSYKAIELYSQYTEEEKYPNPINIPSILNIEEEESNSLLLLDELHLTTVDYLVKQYQHWPNDEDKLVIYIHNLLNKQMPEILKVLDIGCYYWVLASIDLIQYFLPNHRFHEARHHLAAADYMMEKLHKEKLIDETASSESVYAIMLDKYNNACANIARYWGLYGIALLSSSKKRLYQIKDECCEIHRDSKSESLVNSTTDFLLFTDLEKDLESITNKITDTYVLNFDDTKTVLVNILRWLDIAKSYFTIEKNFLIYGRILLEIFRAYKLFAHFEQYKVNLIKIYRKQIEILENAIIKLHPKAGRNEEYQICMIFHMELGIAYSAFSSIMANKLDDKSLIITVNYAEMDPEASKLAKNALKYFKLCLTSL